MIKILSVVLFCWLFFLAIKLTFKIAWGVTKLFAGILVLIALPAFIGCLLLASGVVLLIPVALIAVAWIMLKTCV